MVFSCKVFLQRNSIVDVWQGSEYASGYGTGSLMKVLI